MAQRILGPREVIVLDASTAWSLGVLRGFTDAARAEHQGQARLVPGVA